MGAAADEQFHCASSYTRRTTTASRTRPLMARVACIKLSGFLLMAVAQSAPAQQGAPNGEWRTYGGDLGHTRYSPLDEIDASNFNRLEIAWRFKTDSLGPNREFNFQSTPLMVDGVVYSTAGSRRAVVP